MSDVPTYLILVRRNTGPNNLQEGLMMKVSDRGESKGLFAIVMVVGLVFALIAVFDHIAGLQNHWAGSL